MNELELIVDSPIGPDYVYALSVDNTVSGIAAVQTSRVFSQDAIGNPFRYGQFYRVFHQHIILDTGWSEERSKLVRVTREDGGFEDDPTLHAVLTAGNTSTLNAQIGKLFLTNNSNLTAPNRALLMAWDAFNNEVGYLSDAEIAARFGSGGGTALVPGLFPAGTLPITGYNSADGKFYTQPDAKVQERLVTLLRLSTLLSGATEGNSQNITHLTGVGPNGVFRFPLASLPSGTNTTTNTAPVFINLPQLEYVTPGVRPRRLRIGILPASGGGTTDIYEIKLTSGKWANIGSLTVNTINATFRNRDDETTGFKGRYDRIGKRGPVVLECWLQTDGRVFIYTYVRAGEPFAHGHFLAHGSGGASVDTALTPVTGTLPSGAADPDPDAPGKRIFSTDIDSPYQEFDDDRHLTTYATIIQNELMANQLKAEKPSRLRNPQTALLIMKDEGSTEYVPATPAQEDAWLSAKGVAFISANRPTGLLLNIALPDQMLTVGTARTISLPQNTFANGTAPYVFGMDSPLPPGMSFASGAISGTPLTAGTFPVFVVATDSSSPARTGRTGFNIIIASNVNNAPYIAPVAPYQHTFGTVQTITLPAGTDPEGDALTYSIITDSRIVVNNNSRQMVIPASLPVGQYYAQYTAMDAAQSYGTPVVINVVQAASLFTMGTPVYNSASHLVTIVTTGGDGTPIVYSIVGVVPPNGSPGPHRLSDGLIADPKVITLIAIQSGIQVETTLDLAAFAPGVLPGPVAPAFPALNVTVGQSVSVARPSFTPPAGHTITNYTYAGLPPGLSMGINLAGSGGVSDGIVRLYGTPSTGGSYTIQVTAYASNGTQTTATWSVFVGSGTTGGFTSTTSTNPGKLSLAGRVENGFLLLENTVNPGGGFYKIGADGEPPLTRTDLSGSFPLNQAIYVEWFQTNTPSNGQPSAAQTITFYTT